MSSGFTILMIDTKTGKTYALAPDPRDGNGSEPAWVPVNDTSVKYVEYEKTLIGRWRLDLLRSVR